MASTAAVLNIMVAANTAPASAQLTALQGQLAKTNAQANATTGAVGGISKGGKMAAVGLGAAAVAAIGVGKALTASVGAARSFESSFAEVRKTVDTNEQGFRRIERGLRNLAKQIPVPVEELNNLAGEAGALGIAAKDIVTFTRVAAQLGTTTNLSSNDAANALARLSNIMGTSSSKFENLASTLVGLGNAGASTESEIADMALRIAATGKQVGLSEAQVLGFASALSSVGIEAEAGGSAISRAFSLISESVATGNEKLAGFASVANMSVPAFSKLFERNAAQGMLAFIDGLSQIRENGGNALVELEKLGINEIRLRNALLSAAGAGDLFNNQLRQAAQEFKNNSALSEEARKRYETFDSQVEILRNNIKDLAITVGLELLPALTTAAKELTSAIQQLDGTSKKTTTLGTVFKVLSQIVYGLVKVFQVLFRTMKRVIEATIEIVKGFVQMFKGSFQIITGLLTGNWRKAWNGAKNVAGGAIKIIVGAIRSVTAPVRSVFQGIAEIVKDKFRSAYQSAVSFINRIISVLNSIPFLPDIGLIGGNNFGEGSSRRGAPPGRPGGMQRGGALRGGSPTGDSIPAMLERGEYVLNREAVKKIGVERLNKINFSQAPRFQTGGYIDTLTEFPAKFFKPIKDAGTSALELLMNGPGQFLKLLPKPNISQPFTAVGPYLLDAAKAFIKRVATSPLKNNDWVDSNTFAVARFLASKFNASISSSYRSPAQNAAVGGVPNSSHTRGTPSNPGAFDFVPPSGGMQSFAGKNIAGIVENMIHDVGSGLHNHIAFFQKGGFVGNINRRYPEANSAYGNWGGPTLPSYVVAALAQAAGMPGKTMEQVTRGESGAHKKHSARPGATGIDPGGTKGHGLWMITSGYNEDLAAKVGGWGQMLNPVINAWAAAQIYRRQGLRAWYGTGSVTGDGLDYTGKYDIRKALGGYGYQGALYRATGGKLGSKPKGKVGAAADKADKAKEAAKKKAKANRIKKKIARIAARGLNFPGSNKIASLEAAADKAIETIDLFDREATAEWSPAGSDYDQGELSSLISYYQGLLDNYLEQRRLVVAAVEILRARIAFWQAKIQATQNPGGVVVANGQIITPGKKWQIKGWRKAIGNARSTIGTLGEKRVNLEGLTGEGGLIADTQFRLRELGATPTSISSNDSEIADLLREQLRETQRALAITQAQMPVFQQFMPRFHQGGIVQGPIGAERPVMAQAGEGIFTREQMRAMGSQNITVVIEDAAIDSNRIRVEVDGVIQEKVSTVRRQGSNRRFATK